MDRAFTRTFPHLHHAAKFAGRGSTWLMAETRDKELRQKRRIRNSALLFGGIALLIYLGFIMMSGLR